MAPYSISIFFDIAPHCCYARFMSDDHSQPENIGFAELAQLLKSSGDPLRLEILRALARDSFGVLELCQLFDAKQSGMSHHLKVLANAGLVDTRKEGNSIFYRRKLSNADDLHSKLRKELFRSIDRISLSESVQSNMGTVYEQRAHASKTFFSENVQRFKQQQDLIAAYDVYGVHVLETIRNASLDSQNIALEVGPGAGECLLELSNEFENVIALDNSEEMLSASQKRCSDNNVHNIEFVHNDTRHCRDLPNTVDCAVINMVLHHTPSPLNIFEDVASALKSNGLMVICDLCEHNQDWTREACGDLWLGFAPEDLATWAVEAGLKEGQSSYFALRNGFQIQIRAFKKL